MPTDQVGAVAAVKNADAGSPAVSRCARRHCRQECARRAVRLARFEIAPAFARESRPSASVSASAEQIRQAARPSERRSSSSIVHAGRRVEIGIDKLDRLVDALGRKNAAGERIKKTLRDLPADRLRDERRIDGLGRAPDSALCADAVPSSPSTRFVRPVEHE